MEKLVTLCSKKLYESLSGVQIYEITKLVDCYNKPKTYISTFFWTQIGDEK